MNIIYLVILVNFYNYIYFKLVINIYPQNSLKSFVVDRQYIKTKFTAIGGKFRIICFNLYFLISLEKIKLLNL